MKIKEILATIEKEFEYVKGNDLVNMVIDRQANEDLTKVIKYPYKEFDRILRGIFPTSFVIVGADTGTGKSEMMGLLAHSALKQEKNVVYFDFENDEGDFIQRQICKKVGMRLSKHFSVADFKTHDIKDGQHSGLIYSCASELADEIANLRMYDNSKLPKIDDFIEQLESLEGVDLVCIDHLHYFDYEGSENQSVQIGRIMRALRDLTKKNIPIIIASHLKPRQGNKKPSNYDLFGSSNISKEAKTVILMSREDNLTRVQITKNRDGGQTTDVMASFNPISKELEFDPAFKNKDAF